MPQRENPWDIVTKQGNPTRSKSINNFVRKIRELEGGEGSSKKRKKSLTPNQSMKAPRVEQPTAAVANNVGGANPNAVISSILQKIQLQNSITIDFFGTVGTTIDRFRSALLENNQSITAEIQRLNQSLQQAGNTPAPMLRVTTAAAVPPASLPPPSLPQPVTFTSPARVSEQTWFYDHPDGSKKRVPPSWKFPSGTLLELYTLWHLGDPENHISPMRTFSTSDVSHCGNRSRMNLSEARCLANAVDREVTKAGRSITPYMSQAELVDLFRVGVKGIKIPLATPTGRQRDIFRLKWSTFTKYKLTSNEEDKSEENEGKQLTYVPAVAAQAEQDGSIWLYEHEDGSKLKVPSTWKFPMVSLQDIYVLWNCKDETNKIEPMKTFNSSDVSFLHKGAKNLAEVRGMMNIISKEAASKGSEIKAVMTPLEALQAFSAGVHALNIPPMTPQGKSRDVDRTKWSSASRFKQVESTAKSIESSPI